MRESLDYTFDVSLSTQKFDHKPTENEVKKLRFKKTTTDVGKFLEYMMDGYCYASVFSENSFGMGGKNNKDFRYTYIVSIDVDHSSETMNDMVERLDYKPSFAYTSCRNGLDGESRFRMVYCFEDKIEDVGEYKDLVYAIFDANKLDINEDKYDRGSKEACRYFNGNGTDTFEFTTTDMIYSKEDFNISLCNNKNSISKNNVTTTNNKKDIENNKLNKSKERNNIALNGRFIDKRFGDDFWSMKIGDILAKYVDVYPNLEHTPFPTADEDTPYILFPNDYIEIRRKWSVVNGGRTVKIKDGQGRRMKLFLNGILRRRINPDITFDNLLYNLLYELYHYISNDNAKNKIGKKEIYEIANRVMDADLAKIEAKGTDRSYMVNRAYCAKYRKSPNEVKNIAAKAIRSQKIGELYDCGLTDKQNSEMMKEYGLNVSERTIRRWRKDNGIAKYKKKK